MIRLFKRRAAGRLILPAPALGYLEVQVMEILWAHGESSVHDVIASVQRPLAYTTIMTTMDRLFKKGLLNRRKLQRAFLYSPRLSKFEWEQARAQELVRGFLTGPEPRRELLISSLVEAFDQQDDALLDELERKIKIRRKALDQRRKS